MQVTETLSQGLKREFKVVLPAHDLASRLEAQLEDLKGKVRINGFRPGKVPLAHLRRLYGKSVMADIVQEAVTEANRKIVEENGIRLALEPKVDFPGEKEDVENALEAKGDLAFTVNVEVLPKFDIGSFEDLALEREVAPISEADVDEALQRLVDSNRAYNPKGEEAAAAGDKVSIDFIGKIEGAPFEGGSGSDVDVVLGSNGFIPGFEAQLEGARAGDSRVVKATFPADYQAAHLAGKEAEFEVTIKKVAAPADVAVDDAFAKGFNFEGLAQLREAIRENLGKEFGRATREKLKRALLDELDKRYSFELPEGLVEQEFALVWRQVEAEQKRSGKTFEEEGSSEEKARAEYRRIAERRVRLGLLLADVGAAARIELTDEEVSKALSEHIRRFPGQEQAVWNYYRKNKDAMDQFRAPLLEEKIVDHILAQARLTDREVAKQELFTAPDDELPEGAPTP